MVCNCKPRGCDVPLPLIPLMREPNQTRKPVSTPISPLITCFHEERFVSQRVSLSLWLVHKTTVLREHCDSSMATGACNTNCFFLFILTRYNRSLKQNGHGSTRKFLHCEHGFVVFYLWRWIDVRWYWRWAWRKMSVSTEQIQAYITFLLRKMLKSCFRQLRLPIRYCPEACLYCSYINPTSLFTFRL